VTGTTVTQIYFDDVAAGDALPEERHEQSHVQLFRYSAVTYNSHRIHYDQAYAATEGYPDVLTQSHLHGAFLTTLCTNWMGEQGRLERLSVSIRKYAVPGDVLVCRGRVTEVCKGDDGMGRINLELEEVRERDGAVCAPGTAVVALPLRDAAGRGAEKGVATRGR
jgi:acyl dehydratase